MRLTQLEQSPPLTQNVPGLGVSADNMARLEVAFFIAGIAGAALVLSLAIRTMRKGRR